MLSSYRENERPPAVADRRALPAQPWQECAGFEGRGGELRRLGNPASFSKPFPETEPARRSGGSASGPREARSLDRHASIASPAPLAVVDRKRQRHAMRRAAGKALPSARVATCGQNALGARVSLHVCDGQGHFSGIETCGSVWTCAVCAPKITEGRRQDIDAVLAAHHAAGGDAYMATLTIPHHRFQQCVELRKAVSQAWRVVKTGKGWQRARERYSWLGDIRALEITHGENGWHPHLHVLVFFKVGARAETAALFGSWLFDAWARAIARQGFGTCNAGAFTWEKTTADKGAAEYVGKWGAALELTKSHTKRGRSGRTPWQILADLLDANTSKDRGLFREYARAFHGAHQLTWSRKLRPMYLAAPEASDEELSAEPTTADTQIAAMDRRVFDALVKRGKTADLLLALEEQGLVAAQRLLTRLGIPWGLCEVPGFAPGIFVPCITGEPSPETSRGSPGDTAPNRENKGFSPEEACSEKDLQR